MIHHVVMWKFHDQVNPNARKVIISDFAKKLEEVKVLVDGVLDLKIIENQEASSNMDFMLISSFENSECLDNYQSHPKHLEAGRIIKDHVCLRSCIDYKDQ